jgi:hypothetical protein
MQSELIITNGDSAAQRMREARIQGEILPWRDILHEGPVPGGLKLEDLSAIRAQFLAQRGWIPEGELRFAFSERDALIRDHARFDRVILWFEHDLYDQLQLLQVLDFFATEAPRQNLFLIQAGRYLGRETPRALRAHLRLLQPVENAHLALATEAWSAFRSPSPAPWAALLKSGMRSLPFLRAALLRLLDELPDHRSGLSRTEWTIIKLIGDGVRTPRDLYAGFVDTEEAFFMGDWSFFHNLDQLGWGGAPLIAGFNGLQFSPALPGPARDAYFALELGLTHLGYSVLSAGADALRHRLVNRAIGGFHLQPAAVWRWDRVARRLYPPAANAPVSSQAKNSAA